MTLLVKTQLLCLHLRFYQTLSYLSTLCFWKSEWNSKYFYYLIQWFNPLNTRILNVFGLVVTIRCWLLRDWCNYFYLLFADKVLFVDITGKKLQVQSKLTELYFDYPVESAGKNIVIKCLLDIPEKFNQ